MWLKDYGEIRGLGTRQYWCCRNAVDAENYPKGLTKPKVTILLSVGGIKTKAGVCLGHQVVFVIVGENGEDPGPSDLSLWVCGRGEAGGCSCPCVISPQNHPPSLQVQQGQQLAFAET